ncbi:MAG: GNAT family N-acetyltransferase [Candidatus Onthomonas sp.]
MREAFSEMRRKDRQLTPAEAYALLERCEYGVLSTVGEDGQPYGVPMSYALEGDTIYLHCARNAGRKCANLTACTRASFTVVGDTRVLPAKFSTEYESAIAFGTVTPAEDRKQGLLALVDKYSPDFRPQGEQYADRSIAAGEVEVYAFHILHLTGKARRKKQPAQPEVRKATLSDLDRLEAIETACFPPEEAADRVTLAGRLAVYPDHFWLLSAAGEPVAFLNGMVTDERDLRDEMYDDPNLHREDGAWQMIFGLDTMPEYRCRGYGGRLLRAAILDAREQGRRGLVLACKEELVPYYSGFGFCNEGLSASHHGGACWYQMRLTFRKDRADVPMTRK